MILETYIRDEVKSCSFASFQRKISKKGRSYCSHMSNVRLQLKLKLKVQPCQW
jgi:predicted nucleic acid-binding Zn finger protein